MARKQITVPQRFTRRLERGGATVVSSGGTVAGTSTADIDERLVRYGEREPQAGKRGFHNLALKIANKTTASILIIGDSISAPDTRWVPDWAQVLADTYTDFGVTWRTWDSTNYEAATSIRSGDPSLNIYNASVTGYRGYDWMGSRFNNAFLAPGLEWDVVIWVLGQNFKSSSSDQSIPRGHMMAPMEQFRLSFPDAMHVMVIPNPDAGSSVAMDATADTLRKLAAERGDVEVVDVHQAFIDAGKPADWYSDSVHPAGDGIQKYVDLVQASLSRSYSISSTADPGWLSTQVENLFSNGDFSAFDGAVPDGWTKFGDGTVEKDSTIKADGAEYSVKIVNDGTTSTGIFETIDATPYQGKTMTLATRLRVNAATSDAGRFRLFANGSTTNHILEPHSEDLDGFMWMAIAGFEVAEDTTTIGVYHYASPFAGSGGQTVWVDQTMLYEGDRLYSVAPVVAPTVVSTNRSYQFDGTNDFISFTDDSAFSLDSGSFSISFWIRGSAQESKGVAGKFTASTQQRGWLITSGGSGSTGKLLFYFQSNAGSFNAAEVLTSTSDVFDDTWHHVVCVFDASTKTQIWIDGVLDVEDTTSIPASVATNVAQFEVGRISADASSCFAGRLLDLQFFETDLNSSQIGALNTDQETAIPGVSRLGWFRCVDQNATEATDSSGNDYHGTKTNIDAAVGQFHYEGTDVPYGY